MTIVNINLCLETSLSPNEINNAVDMAEVIIEALGLKDSPVYSCNVDVDIVEEKETNHAARNVPEPTKTQNDPKYKPRNDGIYHEDGYRIPLDEPIMMLRGKDIGALNIIVEYVEMLEEQPQNKTIVSHLNSSLERLNAFYLYQRDNQHLQSIGCSMRAHKSVLWMLRRAKEKLVKYSFEV